jgi:hypothetical protein
MPDDDKITPENPAIDLETLSAFQARKSGKAAPPDEDDLPVRPEQISNLAESPAWKAGKGAPPDEDGPENHRYLGDDPVWQRKKAAPPDEDSSEKQGPSDDTALDSSKEKYHRLNPYLENVINQLQINFDDYVVPDNFFHQLAEALSITNRGDIYTNALLLTISKLKPLITKKLNVRWTDVQQILNKITKRVHDQQYTKYTIDNVPDGEWLYPANKSGVPHSNPADIVVSIRRLDCEITFDEWTETVFVEYGNYPKRPMEEAEVYAYFWPRISDTFGFVAKRDHLEDAIAFIAKKNVFNSRIQFLDAFEAHYDPAFDWISTLITILDCVDDNYNREVARMLPIGIVQRNYYPGCILARMITLISRQRLGKSTFCQILAGNRDFKSEKWFTRKNIYVASDVTRAAALRGKAVHEYAERAKSSKVDLEAFKSDISSTIEVHRPLFKSYVVERPRWFDSICTTNKKQYNYDTENMRDFGIDVAINGQRIKNDLFLNEYERIFGAVVWNVKHGMSGAPDPRIIDEAKRRQEDRVVESPLRHILNVALALGHIRQDRLKIYGMDVKEEKDGDGNVVTRRYSITYAKMLLYASKYIAYHKLKVSFVTDSIIRDEMEHVRVMDVPWTAGSRQYFFGVQNRCFSIKFLGKDQMKEALQFAMDIIDQDEFFVTCIDDDRRKF